METSTVMFIPSTRGGLLTRMMREREFELSKITKFKVKMQEAGGIQMAEQSKDSIPTASWIEYLAMYQLLGIYLLKLSHIR